MSDISRIGAVLRLEEIVRIPGREASNLPLGTPLDARVAEAVEGGRWILEIGDRRVSAQAATPLAPGDRLQVVASQSGSTIELRILASAPRLDPVQYAI